MPRKKTKGALITQQKWRKANPDKVRAYAAKYRKTRDRKAHNAYMKRWRTEINPTKAKAIYERWSTSTFKRDRYLKRQFGIGAAECDAIFTSQGNKCAICGAEEPGWKKGWPIDHCHTTGTVRGILCHSCNVVLGHIKENTTTLERMIQYLKEHK